MFSNPIYVRAPSALAPAVRAAASDTKPQYVDGPSAGWAVERSARAQGALDVTGTVGGSELSLRYALGGSRVDSPFVALTMPAGPLANYDRITFKARALRPMRVSVELRVPDGVEGKRWHRSVYVDETPRLVTVFFDQMSPRGAASTRHPDLSAADTVLFVVDTVNAAPGSNGQLWLDDVAYGR
jgi:hypothetical protein